MNLTLPEIESCRGLKENAICATRSAFAGVIPQTTANFNELTMMNKTEQTTRRYSGLVTDDNKRIIFSGLFIDYYFANSFANYEKGRLIERAVKSCFDYRESVACAVRSARPFWDVELDLSNATVELRKAKIAGDVIGIIGAANRIERCAKEIARSVSCGVGVN